MKIITRGEAMRIHRQHPASRLFPFCTGKYLRIFMKGDHSITSIEIG